MQPRQADGQATGRKRFGLNGFALKIIAITSMCIDHAGAALFPSSDWMRGVGRLAFPIFAFLLCEGYAHTRNVNRYALRLGIFAVISEIPFNLLHNDHVFTFDAQNIFFTLLIGLLTLYFSEKFKSDDTLYPHPKTLQILIMLAGMFAAQLLRTDYGAFGVAMILLYHHYRSRRGAALIWTASANAVLGATSMAYGYLPIQAAAGLAAVPLHLYNGEKGASAKYLFYAFYPAHIAVIMLIKYAVFQLPFTVI